MMMLMERTLIQSGKSLCLARRGSVTLFLSQQTLRELLLAASKELINDGFGR